MPDNDYLFLNIFVKRFNRHHPSMQTVYSIATVLEYPPYFPELKHNILLLKIQHLSLRMRKNQTGIQLETWSVQFSFFLFSFFTFCIFWTKTSDQICYSYTQVLWWLKNVGPFSPCVMARELAVAQITDKQSFML